MNQDPFSMDDYTPPSDVPQKSGAEPAYFAELNPEQKLAVQTLDGPLLILAGAGTGKTRVLTTRLTHLLTTGRASAGEVLALTFTNKAAQEMQERVARMLGRPTSHMAVGTFHSIAAKLLRSHAELVGLQSNYTILDTDDQIRLLKQIIKLENIDEKKWPAKHMAGLIDRWKNKALTPDKISSDQAFHYAEGQGKKIYGIYQARLKTLNACDFGDLLMHMVNILRKHNDILLHYQNRFRYIMVDEYQDTNTVQYLLLRLLAQKHKNICCVGDDDQSIYGWRGAEIGNILKFEKEFSGAKIVRLEQNYRSTTHILGAASGLIAANTGRLGKTLWTDAGDGDKVSVTAVWDGREEARTVGDEIEAGQRKGLPLKEMAVLVRAGFQTREFEERFLSLGLAYRVIGGLRFYERREIRDAIAYLRIIAQPYDDLALERIINVPKRGFGATSLQNLYVIARNQGISLYAAAEHAVKNQSLPKKAVATLNNLLAEFEHWRQRADNLKLDLLMDEVLKQSGLVEMWKNDKSIDAPGRIENLEELVRAMGEYDSLEEFLEHISLVMENNQNAGADTISIMTLHGAKGLEFDMVFLPGWEETVFPIQRSLDEKGLEGLEEERRLAYVGITRAKKKAHILYAGSRLVFGQWQTLMPSRFIAELPDEHCERSSGLSSGAYENQGITDTGYAEKTTSKPRSHYYNPSWNKKSEIGQTRQDKIAKGKSRTVKKHVKKPTVISTYAIGERVFHDKFGYGVVEDIEGDVLEVKFESSGSKKILEDYVSRP